MRLSVIYALALALPATPAIGQDKGGKADAAAPVEKVVPQVRTTRHSGVFGGQKVNYSATIGETILSAEDGTQKASIVTTSYVREPRDPLPAGYFSIQRRSGFWVGVAADGRVRAQAGRHSLRRA